MSYPPAPVGPDLTVASAPVAETRARRPWSPWSEARRDVKAATGVLAALALVGFPVGLLWWRLAPRADFRITTAGPTVIGNPSEELLVSDDVVFALLLAGVGVLAGLLVWFLLRRRRGVAMLVIVALGTAATAAIAWQLGELLGPAPTQAQINHIGATVTTGLSLNSLAALAVGPFFGSLSYLAAAVFAGGDDLGRAGTAPATAREEPVPDPVS